jgi:serine/threonine-protein kinase HipA
MMTKTTAVAAMLPEKIAQLEVSIDGAAAGQLIKRSTYEFRYADPRPEQAAVALLMPASLQTTWQDGDLFPVMDQNLPEGDLFIRLRAMFPKQAMTPMHLLALIGANGIGRLGYRLPGAAATPQPTPITREALLKTAYTPEVFDALVRAYLSTGAGIAGMQPKIMVPDRPTVPVPSLIVKAAGPAYPGLAANEYLCLTAAQRAGILTPTFALSDDGQLLVLDRFDLALTADGRLERLGFEDIAALAGLRVRDVLSDRKYQGSYQRVAELLKQLQLPRENLHRFFEQVAFTVMVRNGDGHLKNFGVLYRSPSEAWLAPMFDVVTTAIYRYTRYEGGPELEDRTLALKLFAGKHHTKAYPTTEELITFGRKVCEVSQPAEVLQRIAAAMAKVLQEARHDERIPTDLLAKMQEAWSSGLAYAN